MSVYLVSISKEISCLQWHMQHFFDRSEFHRSWYAISFYRTFISTNCGTFPPLSHPNLTLVPDFTHLHPHFTHNHTTYHTPTLLFSQTVAHFTSFFTTLFHITRQESFALSLLSNVNQQLRDNFICNRDLSRSRISILRYHRWMGIRFIFSTRSTLESDANTLLHTSSG